MMIVHECDDAVALRRTATALAEEVGRTNECAACNGIRHVRLDIVDRGCDGRRLVKVAPTRIVDVYRGTVRHREPWKRRILENQQPRSRCHDPARRRHQSGSPDLGGRCAGVDGSAITNERVSLAKTLEHYQRGMKLDESFQCALAPGVA